MAVFLPEYNGYIIDNPTMLFERCDGRRFYYDELDSASVTQNSEVVTINGGQSNYPLAQIDTTKTFEVTAASAQFTLAMFEMANAADATTGDIGALDGGRYAVETGLKITLPFEVQTGSVAIEGLEEATTAAAGKFSVAITAATADTAGSTVITFAADDATVGDDFFVTFVKRIVDAKIVDIKSNASTARGTVVLYWPVYSSGQDCTESAEKGRLGLKIYRVRVTALPGFSNSYKSGATNEVTMSALDPKRADKKVAKYFYEQYDSDGNSVAKSGATVDWNA